jgi:hypothetical protein
MADAVMLAPVINGRANSGELNNLTNKQGLVK